MKLKGEIFNYREILRTYADFFRVVKIKGFSGFDDYLEMVIFETITVGARIRFLLLFVIFIKIIFLKKPYEFASNFVRR